MSDNTVAEDHAVDAMTKAVREEYGAEISSEWVRETFRRGLAAYNEVMNRPEESTSDTSTVVTVTEDGSTVVVPVADVDEGNSEVTQS